MGSLTAMSQGSGERYFQSTRRPGQRRDRHRRRRAARARQPEPPGQVCSRGHRRPRALSRAAGVDGLISLSAACAPAWATWAAAHRGAAGEGAVRAHLRRRPAREPRPRRDHHPRGAQLPCRIISSLGKPRPLCNLAHGLLAPGSHRRSISTRKRRSHPLAVAERQHRLVPSDDRQKWTYWLRTWLPVAICVSVIAMESTKYFGADRTSGPLRWLYESIFGPVANARWEMLHHYIRKSGHFLGYGTVRLSMAACLVDDAAALQLRFGCLSRYLLEYRPCR